MPAAAFSGGRIRNRRVLNLHPATKLGACVLAVAGCFLVPAPLPLLLAPALAGALVFAGVDAGHLVRTARPWWPVALLVVLVHTLTTVEAAPLGHPSWLGVGNGLLALARVSASVLCLAYFFLATPLGELSDSLHWWLRPLRPLGANTTYLGLVLAVALGTAPQVLAEGRRIDAVVRLRRGGTVSRWPSRLIDLGYLVVPLLESVFRRADGLTLSVRRRLPVAPSAAAGPPWRQRIGLLTGVAALVCLVLI